MAGRGLHAQDFNNHEEAMKKQQRGFTLIELLVSMVMFVLVIAAASQVFTTMLTQFKQQGKIQETQIEGLIGLELLRHDIEHAGYGLPWNLDGALYNEAGVVGETNWVDREFNDGPPAGENQPNRDGEDVIATGDSYAPGAIRSEDGDGVVISGTLNDSDVLVVKSLNVARNGAAQRWTRLGKVTATDPQGEKRNGLSGDAFEDSDEVIVVRLGNTQATRRTLMNSYLDATIYTTTYNNTVNFAPFDDEVFIIYGLMPQNTFVPRMPFNRADYYIRTPTVMPSSCAVGTGILYKGQISHRDGLIQWELPLLDCVADMQVVYRVNTGAGADDTYVDAFYTNTLTAAQIREQVREVRVYVLAQEGQRSGSYRFENFNCPNDTGNCVLVGEDNNDDPDFICDATNTFCGREFNFDTEGITDWEDYRWKLYTLVVSPINLRR
jgi:prepilin-type N-terminal cleavage/methylation domain-containing protein